MNPSPEAGLRFECTQCGKCCTNRGEYAYVYLSDDEVDALAKHLELSRAAFKRKYTFIDEYGWRQLRFTGSRCVFLDEADRCGVYPARPVQCRTFPFWREMVQDDGGWSEEARSLCEGVGRGRVYSIEEAEAMMKEFEESDEG